MKQFSSIESYIQSEKDQIRNEESRSLQCGKKKISLSKKIPSKFKKLSTEDNIERLKILSRKISNNIATDKEFEEYGWRMVGE